jgi:hypothetical protein
MQYIVCQNLLSEEGNHVKWHAHSEQTALVGQKMHLDAEKTAMDIHNSRGVQCTTYLIFQVDNSELVEIHSATFSDIAAHGGVRFKNMFYCMDTAK